MELEKYGMYHPTELVDIYWIQNDTHEDILNDVLDMKKIMEDIYMEELHKLQQDM